VNTEIGITLSNIVKIHSTVTAVDPIPWKVYRRAKGRKACGIRKTRKLFKYGRRKRYVMFDIGAIDATAVMTFSNAGQVEHFFGAEDFYRAGNFFAHAEL
jgi:hypothetical protein